MSFSSVLDLKKSKNSFNPKASYENIFLNQKVLKLLLCQFASDKPFLEVVFGLGRSRIYYRLHTVNTLLNKFCNDTDAGRLFVTKFSTIFGRIAL